MKGFRPGEVIGTPGGSLNGATFAANAQVAAIGARGEKQTAAIIDLLTRGGDSATVLHDLRIPISGIKANVDHVVVSGTTITIIDTKVWAGNTYWTLFGRTYRGLNRFASTSKSGVSYPAEKRTLPMARDAYAKHLGVPAENIRLALIVWPSGRTPLNLTFMRSPGTPKIIDGTRLTLGRAGRLFGTKAADPRMVQRLRALTH